MRQMNVRALCLKPNLFLPTKRSRRFPYLLHGKPVLFPNQVSSTDITYVQIGRHHMYLRLGESLHLGLKTLRHHESTRGLCLCQRSVFSAQATPACRNSDQGSVFCSDAYVELLKNKGIRQSMDGKAR
jgi:putative transposase